MKLILPIRREADDTEGVAGAYVVFQILVILVSAASIIALTSYDAGAQQPKAGLPEVGTISTELVTWLKTGMSVVFVLTLIFGVHNMWLANKFTAFKEQTVDIIRKEFEPKFLSLKNEMASKGQLEAHRELYLEILKRLEEKVGEIRNSQQSMSSSQRSMSTNIDEINKKQKPE